MNADNPIIFDESGLKYSLCGKIIGRKIMRDGYTFLLMGNVVGYYFRGWHECQDGKMYPMEWKSPDIIRIKKERKRIKIV